MPRRKSRVNAFTVIVILIFLLGGLLGYIASSTIDRISVYSVSTKTIVATEPMPNLRYCDDIQSLFCVESISYDNLRNPIINIKATGISSDGWYIRIVSNDRPEVYICQQSQDLSETFHCENSSTIKIIELYDKMSNNLIARGAFNIDINLTPTNSEKNLTTATVFIVITPPLTASPTLTPKISTLVRPTRTKRPPHPPPDYPNPYPNP